MSKCNKQHLTLICMKYFCNLLHEMGPRGPTKGNALLTRKNVCVSSKRDIILQKQLGVRSSGTIFIRKMPESSDAIYSRFLY